MTLSWTLVTWWTSTIIVNIVHCKHYKLIRKYHCGKKCYVLKIIAHNWIKWDLYQSVCDISKNKIQHIRHYLTFKVTWTEVIKVNLLIQKNGLRGKANRGMCLLILIGTTLYDLCCIACYWDLKMLQVVEHRYIQIVSYKIKCILRIIFL